MAKSAPATVAAPKAPDTVDLPRIEPDAKNFVKFGVPFNRDDRTSQFVSGILYIPKDQASDIVGVTVTITRKGAK